MIAQGPPHRSGRRPGSAWECACRLVRKSGSNVEEFGRNRELLERNRRTWFRRLGGIAGVAAARAFPLQNPVP